MHLSHHVWISHLGYQPSPTVPTAPRAAMGRNLLDKWGKELAAGLQQMTTNSPFSFEII